MKEKVRLQELLNDTDNRVNKWLEIAEQVFDFAQDARRKFESGTLEEKRQILICLGSNFILKDKILTIDIKKPFHTIKEIAPQVRALHTRLEPIKDRREIEQIYSKNPIWGERGDSNPQHRGPQPRALTN